jgi:ABC-type lipoprotein release transport system permease subunit
VGLLFVGAIVTWILRPRPARTGWSTVGAVIVGILGLGVVILGIFWPVFFARRFELAEDRENRAIQTLDRAYEDLTIASNLESADKAAGTPTRYTTQDEILQKILPKEPSFAIPPLPPGTDEGGGPPPAGCVVGVQIGFSPRDKRGNFDRRVSINNEKLFITVFPVSQGGAVSTNTAYTLPFIIVDDSYSGVYSIDAEAVYAPFATVQLMAGMRPDPDVVAADPTLAFAPRCNELLIRLKDDSDAHRVRILRKQINDFVQGFALQNAKLMPESLQVQTWDEHQARYLGAVENEKVMLTVITGIMSMVALVVIFLIFYMIVRDKTRDIGIIKAIGGSEEGVVAIFLFYGLFIGLVGGILGLISGVEFVTHTNQIHEWIYQTTGIIIWDRSVYLFDRIPDTVHPKEVAVYFCLALLAGVIGALIPAIVAGSEDPVKAVRYE